MAQINVTNLNDNGYDNLGGTEDDGSNYRPDFVISVQPQQNENVRAALPVSTLDWRSTPRGQFIPVHGLDFLIGVSTLQIQQTVELDDREYLAMVNKPGLTNQQISHRAALPVSTLDWRSTPRGQFIPVHGLNFLIGVSTLQIQQTVKVDDREYLAMANKPGLTNQQISHRAALPVSTLDWRSTPRGQFIPVHGLDFLIGVSTLQIQQTVELDDLIARIDSENRYIVRVPNGESLYLASEMSSQTQRCLCGSGRAFVMHLHDNTRQEAMQLQRRLAAASCCFPCRLQEMKVITPPGDYIGRVQQQCTWMIPFFLVRDAHDQVLFAIEGPAVRKRSALMLSEFKIMTGDSLREVGKIAHGWDRDLVSFTTTLSMPNNAVQPRHKALLLAAAFLMEYTYFERAKSSCLRCNCF